MQADNQFSIIRIRELQVYAYHGVFEEETKEGQNFYINAELQVNTREAGAFDELDKTVNYALVCQFMTEWMQENTCLLIESVAEKMATALLLEFPPVRGILLEIRKPEAPIGLPFESVSVEVYRKWNRAYIAFGSNMGDRGEYIEKGIDRLAEMPGICLEKKSSVLETKPYGVTDQPNFLNGVVEITTLFSPEELLVKLHEIEAMADRKRELRWGPRTLDLDILLYEDIVYSSGDLQIPHVDMQNRYFVLKPLSEIAPKMVHPVLGKTIGTLLEQLSCKEGAEGMEV